MPLYDYRCESGHVFEVLLPTWDAPGPACNQCLLPSRRLPSSPVVLRNTPPPRALSEAPRSWEGLNNGDAETITGWRRTIEARQKFEQNHPEHREVREAIAAHEGVFEAQPLTYRELAAKASASGDARTAVAEAEAERRAALTQEPHNQ